MSDNAPESEIIDFGFSAGDVDLSRPVLKAGKHRFRIVSTTKKPSTNGSNLATVFELAEPVEATKRNDDGTPRIVQPGFKITMTKPMQDSGKMRPGQWREWPTTIQLAATGDKGALNTGGWINKEVLCDVTIRPAHTGDDGKTYEESNDIARVHPLPK
jgi:hypothetical protein